MPIFCRENGQRLIKLTMLLLVWSSKAVASPTYTLTDLEVGAEDLVFTTNASGNGIVIAGNTTVYPFAQPPAVPISVDALGLPAYNPLSALPANETAYNNILNAVQNASGTVAATGATAVETWNGPTLVNSQAVSQSVFYTQKNADGSWSAPTLLWTESPTQYVQNIGQFGNEAMGINSHNQVIGIMQTGTGSAATDSGVLYDINTKTLTDLSTLPSILQGGFVAVVPFAIDDDGRILASVLKPTPGGYLAADTVLLTPDGVTSDPVPLPEPSTLAITLLSCAFYATYRCRKRARPGSAPELQKIAK